MYRQFQILRNLAHDSPCSNVLNEQQIAHCRDAIEHATWVDGRVTAGYQSASVKYYRQLPEDSKEAHELGDMIVAALERHPMFISAAPPLRRFSLV